MWITFTKNKCGALNTLNYDRWIWGNLYVINLPLIYLKTLFGKLSCPRGPMPVCGSHAGAISSHLSHYRHFLSHLSPSQSERGRMLSAQANVTLHGLSCTHIVTRHGNSILGVFFYIVIIPFF